MTKAAALRTFGILMMHIRTRQYTGNKSRIGTMTTIKVSIAPLHEFSSRQYSIKLVLFRRGKHSSLFSGRPLREDVISTLFNCPSTSIFFTETGSTSTNRFISSFHLSNSDEVSNQ